MPFANATAGMQDQTVEHALPKCSPMIMAYPLAKLAPMEQMASQQEVVPRTMDVKSIHANALLRLPPML
jgi:hypothetical protein